MGASYVGAGWFCLLRALYGLHLDCMHLRTVVTCILWCAAMSEWEVPRRLEEPEGRKQRWRLEIENRKEDAVESRDANSCDVIGLDSATLEPKRGFFTR